MLLLYEACQVKHIDWSVSFIDIAYRLGQVALLYYL